MTFKTRMKFIAIILLSLGQYPKFADTHYVENECADFKTYLHFQNSLISEILLPLEQTCAVHWFVDSGAYFLDMVYTIEGTKRAIALSRSYNHFWHR